MSENKIIENNSKNKIGRPQKTKNNNIIPWAEIDSLLVHGEEMTIDEKGSSNFIYPSHREIAKRYNVSHGLIGKYAKQHNCTMRRKSAEKRVKELSDIKLAELRSDKLALTRDDIIRTIDKFLAQFEEALVENRVRCDNPTDFNTMVRLKAFIMGDADSRHELVQGVTLETLQEAHKRMLEMEKEMTPETCGVVPLHVVEAEVIRDGKEEKDEQGDREDDTIDFS